MTTYRIVPERDGVFEAWAVIATGLDGNQRYMSQAQARTTVDRLAAMVEAQAPTR
jgi:hypothetical protein